MNQRVRVGEHTVRKVRNWFAGMLDYEAIGAARLLADFEDLQE